MSHTFDYNTLKKQLDEEYRIEEYQSKLKALDIVREMMKRGVAASSAPPVENRHTTNLREAIASGPSLLDLSDINEALSAVPSSYKDGIRQVLPELPAEFTNDDIIAAAQRRYPNWQINRGTLRATLADLVEDGDIEAVSIGGGKERTIYRRT